MLPEGFDSVGVSVELIKEIADKLEIGGYSHEEIKKILNITLKVLVKQTMHMFQELGIQTPLGTMENMDTGVAHMIDEALDGEGEHQ